MTNINLTSTGPLQIEQRRGDYALSVRDAATILKVSTKTVFREIQRGNLSAVTFAKNCKRVMASELCRYVNAANNPQ